MIDSPIRFVYYLGCAGLGCSLAWVLYYFVRPTIERVFKLEKCGVASCIICGIIGLVIVSIIFLLLPVELNDE